MAGGPGGVGLVTENILEEMDEDMNSNGEEQCDNEEEEEKGPGGHSPKVVDKLKRKKFLYRRTCFRVMGEFFKQLF